MSVPSGPGKTPHFQWKLADDVEPKLAEGFRRHPTLSPLTQPWEPIYSRLSEQSVELGLRIRHEHCDGRQVAHGGLISTLADHAMALSCLLYPRDERAATSGPSTLNLACDIIGTGRPGQWLEARPRVLRLTRSLGFAECLVNADDKLVARVNATFRLG